MPPVVIAADDVCAGPYPVCILVKRVAFLSTLHWPASGADLGSWWVSFVELLLLYELWAGERLVLEKRLCLDIVGQVAQFQCRLFLLVQALMFGDHFGSLGLSCGHCVPCLMVLADLFLA